MGLRAVMKAAWAKVVFERAFPFFERLGLHVLPIHFYSPVPDTRELRRTRPRWDREWSLTGIDFDEERQSSWIGRLAAFQAEFSALDAEAEVASRGFGEGYGEVESRVLHAMLRSLKPRTVIEVGSGVSTFFAANALAMNGHETGHAPAVISIEPYPYRPLRTLPAIFPGVRFDMITQPVQDVSLDIFKELGDGDVLFIDSSHVSRLDSDVDRLYLEVLPSLRPGVIIHVDDIPFPYLARRPDHWIFRKHRFWNEAAVLNAFLSFNSSFNVLFSLSYLHCKQQLTLQALTEYDAALYHPASIWLQRVR
jgi:predicted O-methyltransferase YrrM